MEKYLMYIYPVFAFAMLTAGWMAVQLLARKIGTKNHIEDGGGCCGACEKKDTCAERKNSTSKLKSSDGISFETYEARPLKT